jgi:hypothetical protein
MGLVLAPAALALALALAVVPPAGVAAQGQRGARLLSSPVAGREGHVSLDLDSTSTAANPSLDVVWQLFLPIATRDYAYDPWLYDNFEDIVYDHAHNPDLWWRIGHSSYSVGQWGGSLVFGSGMAPAHTGADLYLIKPPKRRLAEVSEFEAKLKFDAGPVGGFASVKTQISMDQGGGKGWWTQCMLSAGNSTALFYSCDVSTYDGPNRTTEYRTLQIPTSFGVWHTAKIEADPGTARLSFYLDGVLIGTHLPQDAAVLLSATNLSPKVGVWNGALGIATERYADDVRITPAW